MKGLIHRIRKTILLTSLGMVIALGYPGLVTTTQAAFDSGQAATVRPVSVNTLPAVDHLPSFAQLLDMTLLGEGFAPYIAASPLASGHCADFYFHHSYRGLSFRVCPGGRAIGYRYLSWFDDQISSLKAGGSRTCLWEDAHFGGRHICFRGNRNITHLSAYGWNDRAGSLVVYP